MVSKVSQYDELQLAEKLNDASIDRLMAINTDWKIISWNKAAEIITGIKKADTLGRSLVEIFPQLQEDTEMMNAYTLAFQGKKHFFLPKQKPLIEVFTNIILSRYLMTIIRSLA